ncbi:MAG: hypothetical protein ACOY35_00690 [Bacillota bacterium]
MKPEIRERIEKINRDEVPDGYKRTKVGIIPIGWELKSFDVLFDFDSGYSASRNDLSDRGVCYLHYGDIHARNKDYIDVVKEFHMIPRININLEYIDKKYMPEQTKKSPCLNKNFPS